MIASGADIALRAVGAALASVSLAFAVWMVSYGGGEVRVVGMEHLAIFAQRRGPTLVSAHHPIANAPSVDMDATGSVAGSAAPEPGRRPEIIAARSDRAWLRVEGKIVAVVPGENLAGLGRVGAIVPRGDGWALLDDAGATLLTLPGSANGAALFSRGLIFD